MEKKELIYYRLDEVDEKILAMLQDNARVSLKDIGAEVSMSPTGMILIFRIFGIPFSTVITAV